MQTTRASAVIQVLKSQFDRHRIPHTVVSDNGPQFACDEFKTFAAAWSFIMQQVLLITLSLTVELKLQLKLTSP